MGERGYYIIQMIKDSLVPISAKEIQKNMEDHYGSIDIKTIYRDIASINAFFQPILKKEYIKTIHRKGYCIENEYFEDGQLQYLLDSILFNPNLSKEESNELVTKVLNISSENQKQRMTISNPKKNNQNISLLLNLTTLLKAVTNKQNIYFEYINYKVEDHSLKEISSQNGNYQQGNKTYYIVSPYQVVLRGSNYYLLGYYNQRKDTLSMYRIDRMKMIRHHSSKFIEIREQYDLEQIIDSNINMFISDQHIEMVFRFKDSVLREVVNQFGSDFEVHKEIDGWNKAIIKDVALSNGLLGWIFMLQEQIEIIYPLSLKQTMIDKIKTLSMMYNK